MIALLMFILGLIVGGVYGWSLRGQAEEVDPFNGKDPYNFDE